MAKIPLIFNEIFNLFIDYVVSPENTTSTEFNREPNGDTTFSYNNLDDLKYCWVNGIKKRYPFYNIGSSASICRNFVNHNIHLIPKDLGDNKYVRRLPNHWKKGDIIKKVSEDTISNAKENVINILQSFIKTGIDKNIIKVKKVNMIKMNRIKKINRMISILQDELSELTKE